MTLEIEIYGVDANLDAILKAKVRLNGDKLEYYPASPKYDLFCKNLKTFSILDVDNPSKRIDPQAEPEKWIRNAHKAWLNSSEIAATEPVEL